VDDVNDNDELAELLETGRLRGTAGGASGAPGAPGAEDVRGLLGDESVWAEPAPGGLDALLAAIEAESPERPAAPARPEPAGPEPVGREPVGPEPAGPAPAGQPAHLAGRRRRRGLALVGAVAAALLVAAGVAGVLARSDGEEGREVALSGTELAPEASGTARVEETPSGVAISVDVSGLPPAEPGTYYQGWVRNEEGQTVTVGTFHIREGDDTVELWSGVELEDYPVLTVTLQQEGAGPESSGQVVLTGRIAP
jgi:hypothetical protein